MNIIVDTNVLVPLAVTIHPDHDSRWAWLEERKMKKDRLYVSAHTLAETFAVLVKLPVDPRNSPKDAARMVRELRKLLSGVITLTATDYITAMQRMGSIIVRPGQPPLKDSMIYDILVAQAARKREIEYIATSNIKGFERFWPASKLMQPYTGREKSTEAG